MDPTALIPLPDAIPVTPGWLYGFSIVTFAAHLLCMNAMVGLGIIAVVSSFQKQRQDGGIPRQISINLPYFIAFTINLGVAPLLFIQVLYGHFIYTSSVLMGWYWLLVIPLLIIAYYSAYIYDFKFDILGRYRTFFIVISTGLILIIAFLFTNNMTLMLSPEKWKIYFTSAKGMVLNLDDPTLIPRYLHYICASAAVAGLVIAMAAKMGRLNQADPTLLIHTGMRWFVVSSIIQMFIGIWYFFTLPDPIRHLFFGNSKAALVLAAAGLSGAAMILYTGLKKQVRAAFGSLLFTILIMIFIRDLARKSFLEPYFQLRDLTVTPEYSPLVLFLVCFAVGIALTAYMLKLARKTKEKEDPV